MVHLQLHEMLQKYTEGCNHNYTVDFFLQIILTNISLVPPFLILSLVIYKTPNGSVR